MAGAALGADRVDRALGELLELGIAGTGDSGRGVLVVEDPELGVVRGGRAAEQESGDVAADLGERVAGRAGRRDRLLRGLAIHDLVVSTVVAAEAAGGALVAQVVGVGRGFDLHLRRGDLAIDHLDLLDRLVELGRVLRGGRRVVGLVGQSQVVDRRVGVRDGRIARIEQVAGVLLDVGQGGADAAVAHGAVECLRDAGRGVAGAVVAVEAVHRATALRVLELGDVAGGFLGHGDLVGRDERRLGAVSVGHGNRVDDARPVVGRGVGDVLLHVPVDALGAFALTTRDAGARHVEADRAKDDRDQVARVGLVLRVGRPQYEAHRTAVGGDLLERVAAQAGVADRGEVGVVGGRDGLGVGPGDQLVELLGAGRLGLDPAQRAGLDVALGAGELGVCRLGIGLVLRRHRVAEPAEGGGLGEADGQHGADSDDGAEAGDQEEAEDESLARLGQRDLVEQCPRASEPTAGGLPARWGLDCRSLRHALGSSPIRGADYFALGAALARLAMWVCTVLARSDLGSMAMTAAHSFFAAAWSGLLPER